MEMPAIPKQSAGYFRAYDDVFIHPALMLAMQILAFAPLLLISVFHFSNHRKFLSAGRIRRELSAFFGTLAPFFLAYGMLLLLTLLRRLPGYSGYPPPPKDPVLNHPLWAPLLAVFITTVLVASGIYFLVKFLNRGLARPDFYVSKSLLLAGLCAVTVLALLHNSYWAVSFFLVPAWLWSLLGPGVGPGGRAANRLVIIAAGIVYYMAFFSFANRMQLGLKLVWYSVLALGSGAFSAQGYFLSACVVTLGIRFLAIQSYSRAD